jgi:LAGLIDADG DNA endonuclease family protein
MADLPLYQQKVLDAVQQFWSEHNRPPTMQEIADILDTGSSHIATVAMKLRKQGYLHERRGLHLPESKLLRPNEAAAKMGISRSHLNALMKTQEVTTVRSPGGYHLIHTDEVEKFNRLRFTPHFGIDFSLDPAWSNWLVGFTDGEGTFGLIEHRKEFGHGHYFGARYQLFQRSDRRWILEQVKSNLQCGHLYDRRAKMSAGPGTYFVVIDHASLTRIIVPFFDAYPPRMKHEEYNVWREAVHLIVDGNHNFNRVAELREQLRYLYAYHE